MAGTSPAIEEQCNEPIGKPVVGMAGEPASSAQARLPPNAASDPLRDEPAEVDVVQALHPDERFSLPVRIRN
jgi:hypothetical protein